MTAFPAATDFYSPEAANKRLENAVFLTTSDLLYWDRLLLEISQLSHHDETIPVPSPLEAGAWKRAYVLFERLRDRAAAEERQGVTEHKWFADDQRAWNDYISDREQVLQMLAHDVFDEDVLTDHLDVQLPGDLAPPTTSEADRYGSSRHPEWRERATRLSSAIRWWDMLGAEERKAIKTERAMRKLRAFKEERAHGW